MKKLLFPMMALMLAPVVSVVDSSPAEAYPPGPRVYRPGAMYRGNPGYRPIYRPAGPRYWGPVYRPAPVYVQPPVVVRPVPVYVERPAPVIVERPVAVTETAPPTVMREEVTGQRDLIAVGIHGTAVGVEGQKVGLSTAENPAMGGIGVSVKGRFDESWGLELSADFLSGSASNADLTQSTIPVMAALTWHILPNSRFQPYLLAGAGVHFTRLNYLGGDYAIDITEFAGQFGGGLEVFLTENIAINADIRFNTIFRNLDQRESVHTDCLRQTGQMNGFCDNIHYTGAEDKVNLGAQFKVGASWYF
jgi:opacity protein-like surface antigen